VATATGSELSRNRNDGAASAKPSTSDEAIVRRRNGMENIGAVFEITPTKSTSHLSSSAAPCVLFCLLCLFEVLSGRNSSDKDFRTVLGQKKKSRWWEKGESSKRHMWGVFYVSFIGFSKLNIVLA
jgi:hypothetical protein